MHASSGPACRGREARSRPLPDVPTTRSSHNGAVSAPSSLLVRADESIASLAPGYFALVMASGIVSVGLRMTGFGVAARALLVLALVAAAVLVVLFALRALRHGARMRADARSPVRAFGSSRSWRPRACSPSASRPRGRVVRRSSC